MNIPAAIKALRENMGQLSQQDLAVQMGLSVSAISKYESGARVPSGKMLVELAQVARKQGQPKLGQIFIETLLTELGVADDGCRFPHRQTFDPTNGLGVYQITASTTSIERDALLLFDAAWHLAKEEGSNRERGLEILSKLRQILTNELATDGDKSAKPTQTA